MMVWPVVVERVVEPMDGVEQAPEEALELSAVPRAETGVVF